MNPADDAADIAPNIKRLVCARCWETVFSPKVFSSLWEGRVSDSETGKEDSYDSRLKHRTPPWAEIREAAAESCGYCTLLCDSIKNACARSGQPEPSADDTFLVAVSIDLADSKGQSLVFKAWMDHVHTIIYRLYTEPNDPAARYIAARDVVWQMDDKGYELALRCIQDCSRHERCPPPVPTTLPTRVLDCADPLRLRLITTDRSQHELYVALSYVWGEGQPHRTTTKNIEAYHTFIDTNVVPKTVKDAITVTRRLGLRYLWVDSFCIIQDSDYDKACEIAKIRSNMRNSFVTIIAARARVVSDGFLHDINPLHYFSSVLLPLRCPDGSLGTVTVNLQETGDLVEATDERAWCLEERVLSPRLLLFCKRAVRYECQAGQRNLNSSPLWLPSAIPRLPDDVYDVKVVGQSPEWQAERAWDIILRMYTRRALTKEKDKLSALAGIASQLHRMWPQSRYLAGIWSHQLPYALLWKQIHTRPRPVEYRAPSWSWASVDGELTGRGGMGVDSWRVHHPLRVKAISEVKSLDVTPNHWNNPYGEVTAAHLVLSAAFVRATWKAPEPEVNRLRAVSMDENGSFCIVDFEGLSTDRIGFAGLDAVEPPELVSFVDLLLVGVAQKEVPFVLISRAGQQDISGLVLLPADEETGGGFPVYRRIGRFDMHEENWPSFERHDLHII